MVQVILSVAVLAATIFTLANIITRDDGQVRYLPKIFWIIIVIVVPIIGMVLWWTVGRDRGESAVFVPSRSVPTPRAAPRPVQELPLEDEDIDAIVEREIEFHENQARIRRLEAQLEEKRRRELEGRGEAE